MTQDEALYPEISQALDELHFSLQEKILPQLGLREPFKDGDIHWQPETLDWVIEQIGDDSLSFLEEHGKNLSFWPEFASVYTDKTFKSGYFSTVDD